MRYFIESMFLLSNLSFLKFLRETLKFFLMSRKRFQNEIPRLNTMIKVMTDMTKNPRSYLDFYCIEILRRPQIKSTTARIKASLQQQLFCPISGFWSSMQVTFKNDIQMITCIWKIGQSIRYIITKRVKDLLIMKIPSQIIPMKLFILFSTKKGDCSIYLFSSSSA